jgi:hypothetical protein
VGARYPYTEAIEAGRNRFKLPDAPYLHPELRNAFVLEERNPEISPSILRTLLASNMKSDSRIR